MRDQAANIDIDSIKTATVDFVKNTKCPYGKVVSYLNKVNGHMTPDRGNKIKAIITHLLASNFNRANAAGYIDKFLDEENLHFKSVAKYKAHIYEILYLQEGLYDVIHGYINTQSTPDLIQLKNHTHLLDLDEFDLRRLWGRKIKTILKDSGDQKLSQWNHAKNKLEPEMEIVEEYSKNHSSHNKSSTFSFITLIRQGIGDGIDNCRDVVQNIPNLYEAKYGARISTSEYRRLVELNMKTVFPQVSTLNLGHLTNILRDPYKNALFSTDDGLTLNGDDFELNDNGLIEAKKIYILKILHRVESYLGQYMFSARIKGKAEHEEQVRLGCPAMHARTKDGKRVTEQFIEDMLQLLDEVYFPYRDK